MERVSSQPTARPELTGGSGHYARHFTKDLADAGGHAGHNCTGRNRNKACHQSVLNQILSVIVSPNMQAANHAQVREP
jgi:hypothetical protein